MIMKHKHLVVGLLVFVTVAQAQTPDPAKELKVRQAKARSLLVALSTDARSFHDQTLRARSLARIADALWKIDPEQGRLLFRKAWEAAEVADQESDRKLQDEIARQRAKTGGGFATSLPPNLRREVLRLAARHDRPLSEEFLEKLKAQKLEAANSATTNLRPGRLDAALSQRLSLARELLQTDEVERALQFADPALSVVGIDSINFLVDLRAKNPAAADSRYAALLSSSANNPQADANTVSLLSSYIFTPGLYMIFVGNGVNTSQMSSKIVAADVSPELRNAFFQAAASILLRPLPQPGQDPATTGLEARYMVTKRLLPLYEQWAPAELVESIRGQLNALNAVVKDETRRSNEDWLGKGLKPDKPVEDREQWPGQERAVGAAAELGVVEQEEQHLSEGERHHEKEEAPRAQRQGTDDQRREPGDYHRQRQRDEDRQALACRRDEIDGVGGKPVEGRVPQADEPRAPHQQLQAERQHGGDQRVGAELHVIGRHEEREHCEQRRRQSQPYQSRRAARNHVRCPNSPEGRQISTAAIST